MNATVHYRFGLLLLVVLCAVAGACNLIKATPTPPPAPTIIQPTPTFIGAPSITPLPGTGDGTPQATPCQQTPAGWVPYTILVGDTLTLLAESTFSTVAALMSANCITNPDDIRAGEIIYLPIQPGPVPTQSG